MNRLISILLMLSLVHVSFVASSMNDDEKPTKPIQTPPIIIIITNPMPLPGEPRTLTQDPVYCEYDPSVSCINAIFNEDLGVIDVTVSNHSSGEYVNVSVDSAYGTMSLPVSGSAGCYSISFVTDSGAHYCGEFVL